MNDRFRYRIPVYKNNEFDGFVYLNLGDKLPDLHGGYYSMAEQCTGLKDKNGKLIYERDIIREISEKEPEWEEYITAVRWKECGFNLYNTEDFDFEIIGNIHENGDLVV